MPPQPARNGTPPNVKLDGKYKFVDALNALVPSGPPSLINCSKLVVEGNVIFDGGVVFEGSVTVTNTSKEAKLLLGGTYKDITVDLSMQPPSKLVRTPKA